MHHFSCLNLVIVSYYHTKNIKVNQLRERCLRLIHNDKRILFISIHHRNLTALAPELPKVCHKMLHGIVSDILIPERPKPHPISLGPFF